MSYRKLEIWQLAKELVIDIHRMTLQLPQFEMFEEGRQIRKSSKSVRTNIVEGYGRRRYKQDFIRFLVYALASCDETIDHLEILYETGSLTTENLYRDLRDKTDLLGKKINRFIQSVEVNHNQLNENIAMYQTLNIQNPESNIQDQVSSIQDQENKKKQNNF